MAAINDQIPFSEAQSAAEYIAIARQELAEKAGLQVDTEPLFMNADQENQVRDRLFGEPKDIRPRCLSIIRQQGHSHAVNSRQNPQAPQQIRDHNITVMIQDPPGIEASFLRQHNVTRAAAAVLNRVNALDTAMTTLAGKTLRPREITETLDNSSVDVFVSPKGGSPAIAQRKIEMSGGTIIEMDALAPGTDFEVLDSQVLVIPFNG